MHAWERFTVFGFFFALRLSLATHAYYASTLLAIDGFTAPCPLLMRRWAIDGWSTWKALLTALPACLLYRARSVWPHRISDSCARGPAPEWHLRQCKAEREQGTCHWEDAAFSDSMKRSGASTLLQPLLNFSTLVAQPGRPDHRLCSWHRPKLLEPPYLSHRPQHLTLDRSKATCERAEGPGLGLGWGPPRCRASRAR